MQRKFLILTSIALIATAFGQLWTATPALGDYIPYVESEYFENNPNISFDTNQIRWGSARLSSPAKINDSWASHFAGNISFPDPFDHPEVLLKLKNPNCSSRVAAMEKLVKAYAKNAERSRESNLTETKGQISELLTNSEQMDCFEDVSRFLAVRSLSLLAVDNRFDICEGSLSQCQHFGTEFSANAVHGELGAITVPRHSTYNSFILSNNWVLNLVAISLLNHDHVELMTPAKKSELGFSSDVLGAYECNKGKIFLNPFMAPMDLAATFAHEIEHVLRDKFFDPSQSRLTAKQFLLLDETLSVAYASFLQRDLGSFYKDDASVGERIGSFIGNVLSLEFGRIDLDIHNKFHLDKDISFFNPDGALNSLWNGLGFKHDWGSETHSLSNWSDFEDMTFLRRDSSRLNREALGAMEKYGISRINSKVQSIFDIVKRVYFNEPLTNEDRSSLSPAILGFELDPLSQALRSNILWITTNLTPDEPRSFFSKLSILQHAPYQGQFLDPRTASSYTHLRKDVDIRFRMDGLLEFLDDLESTFAGPSPMCIKIDEAAKKGELGGYAGFRKGTDGVRPGSDGVRPGVSNVRPGLTLRTCVLVPKTI